MQPVVLYVRYKYRVLFSPRHFKGELGYIVGSTSKTLIKNAGPRGYKTFFMLNSTSDIDSTEHEISTAHKKLKYRQMKKFLTLDLSDVV